MREQITEPNTEPQLAVLPALADQAYAALEERIVTLRLKPGDFLSEYALAAQLGLGRTPIREALQRLVREGLVSVLPRRGILVSTTEPAQQLLVLEVRRELERLLSRRAAERASNAQRQAFRIIGEGMTAASGQNDDLAFIPTHHGRGHCTCNRLNRIADIVAGRIIKFFFAIITTDSDKCQWHRRHRIEWENKRRLCSRWKPSKNGHHK